MTASRRTALIAICVIGSLVPGGRPFVDLPRSGSEHVAFSELNSGLQIRAARTNDFPMLPRLDASDPGDELPDSDENAGHEVASLRDGPVPSAIYPGCRSSQEGSGRAVPHLRSVLGTTRLRC
jgi:hypothetical protein